LRSPREADAAREADRLAELLRTSATTQRQTLRVLGPAPCPVARSHGQFRYHLQLLADEIEAIRTVWLSVQPRFTLHKDVDMVVDVDPLSSR
jgi:primosomal protein N'